MFSQKINSLPSQAVMENVGVLAHAKKVPQLIFSAYSDTMNQKQNKQKKTLTETTLKKLIIICC